MERSRPKDWDRGQRVERQECRIFMHGHRLNKAGREGIEEASIFSLVFLRVLLAIGGVVPAS